MQPCVLTSVQSLSRLLDALIRIRPREMGLEHGELLLPVSAGTIGPYIT